MKIIASTFNNIIPLGGYALALAMTLLLPSPLYAATLIHHDMTVRLDPAEHRITVSDNVSLSGGFPAEITFGLHPGLNPKSPTRGASIEQLPGDSAYRAHLPPGAKAFTIEYSGAIDHPLESVGAEQARGFRQTSGAITPDGAYLAGSSMWYPRFGSETVTFRVEVSLPAKWDAVAQGERTRHERADSGTVTVWESKEPQDEIFLIAAAFAEYEKQAGRVSAMAFLRTPDDGLANKYLDATARYIAMYEKMIGPYPYSKFALVENFWETGYGMPSFTLLGPKIIRMPFIINSSYPHEILHNWWGNSVWPNYAKGNWAEGLTAYLADHLIKEQQGQGAEYRQSVLQKYADYVSDGRDFPLSGFTSRHGSSSEAVGYGKAAIFFHMLRNRMGDEIFIKCLQRFYADNRFKTASFDDLRKSFEDVTGESLKAEFDQWVTRAGAPKLAVSGVSVTAVKNGFILKADVEQVQPGDVYSLIVPVAVTMEGVPRAFRTVAEMSGRKAAINIRLSSRPLRLDIDPEFDVFRRLDTGETPPAITQALGAKKMLAVLPSSADAKTLAAWRALAESLGKSGPDSIVIALDSEIDKLPPDRAAAILGGGNRFAKTVFDALSGYGVSADAANIRIGETEIPRKNHAVVLSARRPGNSEAALLFIDADTPGALPGLARKLPHYHKYSYLAFEGDEPVNTVKGRWPVVASPMTVYLPGADGVAKRVDMGAVPAREPLASLPQAFSPERMTETVGKLATPDMAGRGIGTTEISRAADFIAEKFREAGLESAGDGSGYFQKWTETVGGKTVSLKNVLGVIPGTKPEFAGQSVVIAAHYDHLGIIDGKIYPGSDDNASGVAVLIELARAFSAGAKPERNIVFAAFTAEETGRIGSRHYIADAKRFPAEKCIAAINLDTVGRLGKGKILALGSGSASEWVHIFRGAGYVTGVEVEAVTTDYEASDDRSFRDAGVPAVQLFTGPHADYHKPTDTPEKIDANGLVKVAMVAKEAAEYLASRPEFLTSTLKASESGLSEEIGGMGTHSGRKTSLGIVPDFAFTGKGCRLSGVTPGSPAESCGLREGDVIVKINAGDVASLKDLSNTLKTLKPGERVTVTVMRDGAALTVEAELAERR
ncbi:MAG: M20/M25/M40 family metallo-hydrolase [Nitrospirae bacterium]|nr:M20/M25/M40 family metallo-hydrolase [Nitrospirota bacterium]